MASTYSPLLRIQLMATGEQSGTWGNITNTNLGTLIEEAIAGTAEISVTAGNVTLTSVDGVTDQSRCAAIRVSGTPGVSRNIIAPAASHIYVVANGSNAAVVLKTSVSTGLTIPSGQTYLAYYDPTVGVADFKMVGQAIASTNTANTLVLRDASGNFSAGMITANLTGNVTGNASTVTTNANLTGAVTSSGNATSLGSFTSANLAAALTDETGTGANVFANSPTLVTPALGTPSSGNLANCTFPTLNQNTTGNAATATVLQTARNIGGVSFNGSADINLPGVNTSGNQNTSGNAATVTNGVYTVGDQTIAGAKTFSSDVVVNGITVGRGVGNVVSNTAVGSQALNSNTTGSTNTAVGVNTLKLNTTGTNNTAVGWEALENSNGGTNTAFGYVALNLNTTGTNNTAVGANSLAAVTTGAVNTAVGSNSAGTLTTGDCNLSLGVQSMPNLTTGSANLAFGGQSSPGTYAAVFDVTTQNNRIVMGHTSVTNAYIQVAWTVVSDARDKTDFADIPHGLNFVSKLNPIAYRYKLDREATEGHGPVRYGFKAQEVLALEGNSPVIVDAEDAEKLRFNDQSMIAVLVKAVQELKAEFDAYKTTHP